MSCKVLLVTGGLDSNNDKLDSTEQYVGADSIGSGWRLLTGLLPRPRTGLKMATVDNSVFVLGECHYPLLLLISYLLSCYPVTMHCNVSIRWVGWGFL